MSSRETCNRNCTVLWYSLWILHCWNVSLDNYTILLMAISSFLNLATLRGRFLHPYQSGVITDKEWEVTKCIAISSRLLLTTTGYGFQKPIGETILFPKTRTGFCFRSGILNCPLLEQHFSLMRSKRSRSDICKHYLLNLFFGFRRVFWFLYVLFTSGYKLSYNTLKKCDSDCVQLETRCI